jgi:UDP-2,4-diacetamido-2,4,6-trideoxy-beta-L-altropyranose hydrolase
MKIAFRVDASLKIGTGHFMRCLTMADALRQRGAEIRFVSRRLPDYLLQMLKHQAHDFAPLEGPALEECGHDPPHAHWLETSQAQDAADTVQALSSQSWDWVVVDHYALDARWETMLRGSAKRIAAIDDIADRQHDCDLLLDQNFHRDPSERYRGKVPAQCDLLLGPRYALLREEFRSIRASVKPRAGDVRRILIFFGGVDADNYTGYAIEATAALGISGLQVDVVVGECHPRREEIAAQSERHGFTCHVQTPRMAELIAAADLAIGAGGTAVWERCCLGLPALVLRLANNQGDQIAAAAGAGLLYAPDRKHDGAAWIQRHAAALIENPSLREVISRTSMQAVDGRGVWRVAGRMGCSDIELRAASLDDARNLFEWRNDPSVRAVSRTAEVIDWDTHRTWLTSVLNTPGRALLIGERGGAAVGVVRFDVQGADAEISIYLVPGVHPPGQGLALLQGAERWLISNRPAVGRILAQVLAGNERSQNLFRAAGYQPERTHYAKRVGNP